MMTKQWKPLTNAQWAVIFPFLRFDRQRAHDLSQIVNSILWLLRTGCQWRNPHTEWLNWQTVYSYGSSPPVRRRKRDRTFERIYIALNRLDR